MRQVNTIKRTGWRSPIKLIAGSRTRASIFIIAVLLGSAIMAIVVRAYNRRALDPNAVGPTPASARRVLQDGPQRSGKSYSRLSFQPEANKFRRRIGQRFLKPGRERATLVGRLTVNGEQYQVRIARTQGDDGEQVEIALNGGALLTWSARDGAKSAGRNASVIERSLIERIALDSPDQFVLAQLRGASYYTVDRFVQPAGEVDPDAYTGPVWDLVRIREPEGEEQTRSQSFWRLYYLNSTTGLIDKVISQEQGITVSAQFSDWANRGGELTPTRITWSRNQVSVMELVINAVSHGSLQ